MISNNSKLETSNLEQRVDSSLDRAFGELTKDPLFQHCCNYHLSNDSLIHKPLSSIKSLVSEHFSPLLKQKLSSVYNEGKKDLNVKIKEVSIVYEMVDSLLSNLKYVDDIVGDNVELQNDLSNKMRNFLSSDLSDKENKEYSKLNLNLPKTDLVNFDAFNIPKYKGNSGDLVYVEQLDSNKMLFVLCDVNGKGRKARFYADGIKNVIKSFNDKSNPAKLTNFVRDQLELFDDFDKSGGYATGVFMVYDSKFNNLTYSAPGDNIELLLKNGEIKTLSKTSSPLFFSQMPFRDENESINLDDVNRIILKSDGISEYRNTKTNSVDVNHRSKVFSEVDANPRKILSKLYSKLKKESDYPFDDASALVIDLNKKYK